MTYFFADINSDSLGRKTHISRFLSLFCGEIVVVIYSKLAVAIKDLFLRWKNKELTIRKSAVQFEPASQKKVIDTICISKT